MISLRKAVENYLAMRRSLGFKLRNTGYDLRQFVSFMEEQKASVITTELALRWAQQSQDEEQISYSGSCLSPVDDQDRGREGQGDLPPDPGQDLGRRDEGNDARYLRLIGDR
jgi:hypothetical protein